MSARPDADWVQRWIDAQQTGFDQWLKSLSGAPRGTVPPDFLSSFPPGLPGLDQMLSGPWRTTFAANAAASGNSIPTLGPLREHQELLLELSTAVLEHQQLLAQFTGMIAQVHRDTLDLLARRTQAQVAAGKPPQDGADLHALWVECGEAVYAKIARTDAYCRLQAQLANAAVRTRAVQQQLLERFLKQWDLPTRAELNTVHQQLRALRRQLAEFTTESRRPRQSTKPRSRSQAAKSARKPRTAQ